MELLKMQKRRNNSLLPHKLYRGILGRALCVALCIVICVASAAALAGCGGPLAGSGADGSGNDIGDGVGGAGNGGSISNGADGIDGAGNGGGAGNVDSADGASGAGNGAGGAGNGETSGGAPSDAAALAALGKEAPSGALSISAYDTMAYSSSLEAAAQAFNEKYPDVEIVIDTFSAMPELKRSESPDGRTASMSAQIVDDPQGRADYANKVNTSLMSGAGADILAVDVIPIAKYVESGLLENLSPYMEQDPGFDPAQYRSNILDAVSWKGGTWFLPMDYMFNYYTYDTTLIDSGLIGDVPGGFGADSAFTTEQLFELAIPLYDGETMIINTPSYTGFSNSLLARLLRERWSEFVDIANKRANFTSGSFVEMLNKVVDYDDSGYVPGSLAGQVDLELAMDRMAQAPTDRYYFKPSQNMSLLTFFLRQSQSRYNVGFSIGGASAIDDDDELAGIAANADGAVPFTYTQAFAINANSTNKHAAWEFIKFMLGGEMQASGAGGILRGLPVHNETRERQMENMITSMATGMGMRTSGSGAVGYGRIGRGSGDSADQGGGGGAPNNSQGGGNPGGSGNPDGTADSPGGTANNPGGGSADLSDEDPEAQRVSPDDMLQEIDPEILKKYNDTIERFSDQINTFEIKDAIIDDMIQAEVSYFFEGAKTADEVAATLQSKVELYLNE
ncbi:MAG: extracellular solute-binding protein [Oscillospiraceae bacterium]|nr:extracellular solute-binding protein [Oscillospiraceae bacterium]